MKIVFYCSRPAILPFIAKDIYFKKNNTLNIYIKQNYKINKYKYGELYLLAQDDKNKLFFIISGKNTRIIIQALKGYIDIFSKKEDYIFFNLNPYYNIYLQSNFNFLQNIGIKKCYQKLKEDIGHLREKL